jgi:hypothetical protein
LVLIGHETELEIVSGTVEKSNKAASHLHRGGVLFDCLTEELERGHRLAVNSLRLKDGRHLPNKSLGMAGTALLQEKNSELQGD